MWTTNRPGPPRSSFSHPDIDQDGRDQVSVNQPSTNVFGNKLSMNQQSTTTAEIKFQWTRHRSRRTGSSFSDQPSTNVVKIKLTVNQQSTKTAEIKFQWTRHRSRRSRSNFSEPAINQCSWDQVNCEPTIDQDGRDQVSVNHTSIKTVEIKF